MLRLSTWSRGTRAARSLVCGVVTVGLASAAHVVGGGSAPAVGAATVLVGVVAVAAAVALGGPSSRRRIVAFVLVGQVALHLLLSALSTPMSGSGRAATSSMAGMAHDAAPHGLDRVPAGWYSMVLHHAVDGIGTLQGGLMLAAHVLAALLVGLWLAGGERLLWSLLTLAPAPHLAAALRDRVRLALAVHGIDVEGGLTTVVALTRGYAAPWRPTTRYAANSTVRRGPPSAALRAFA